MSMSRTFYKEVDADGITIYDESDDYDPGEDETVADGGFRLMTNEEIFTDEYMQNYARRMDEKIAREKRMDRITSVCVILVVILVITFFIFINFRRLL